MNSEIYESWFEKEFCQNIKPNSFAILNNASYRFQNSPDFPASS